jgi:hypothetical protein
MAEIIKFPEQDLELPRPDGTWSHARFRFLSALRFVFNSIRAGEALPSKLMIIYEDTDEARTIRYVNIGYKAGEFTDAVVQVQRDMIGSKIPTGKLPKPYDPLKN